MSYYDTHKYIKEMVSRGDLRIVIDEGQIVLQVVDTIEENDGTVKTTLGEGIGISDVLYNAQYSENNLGDRQGQDKGYKEGYQAGFAYGNEVGRREAL